MCKMKINVNSFLSMSCIDGEGVRSVLFVQGCPIKCAYCHNPETQSFLPNLVLTIDDIVSKISKYKNYYGKNGGITISGGEPLYQIDAVTEIFRRCKTELQITTCIETSGNFPSNDEHKLDNLINLSDMIYCDYKFVPQEESSIFINVENSKTEKFLSKCNPDKTIIRTVIIPGINDNEEYIKNFVQKIKSIKNFNKIELLPFKKHCIVKYKEMNKKFLLKNIREATAEEIDKLQKIVGLFQ